jgi:hypothetical protein
VEDRRVLSLSLVIIGHDTTLPTLQDEFDASPSDSSSSPAC